jgi:Kdo2-lipid IVA lauroyltransferase/acyltransferase
LDRKRKVFDDHSLDNPKELPLFTRNLVNISFHVNSPLQHRLEYAAVRLTALALRYFPRKARAFFGISLGQLLYYTGIRTSVTQQNLSLAFPTLPKRGITALTARVYRHFGTVATTLPILPRLSPKDFGRWVFCDDFPILEEALREGKGGIVFSGHLGNWEIMGSMVAHAGFPVTFVVTTQSNHLVEAFIDRQRALAGIEIVKKADAVRGVLSALKRNRLVALLIDQDAHEEGAFVPFFGRLAATPRGPAVFHLRTGAPLIFARSHRLPGERYRIDINRIDTTGYTDPDVLTAHMTTLLEMAIRNTPEQWFWMHRRWKTLPPAS